MKLVALFVAFILLATSGGLLASGLLLPIAATANVAASQIQVVLDEVPAELQRGQLAQASSMFAADGTHLATFFAQNRIVVPLELVSEHMINAIIAVEDDRFFEHQGVDVRGTLRAFINNLQGGSTQGASTITMQFVKNVLIDAAYHDGDPFGIIEAREETMVRKAREAAIALAIERVMTKEEILEGYLNVAQFGRRNIFGVETAARFFFGTTAARLTPVQAATIAGITNAPSRFDPETNPQTAERRRNWVLQRMWQLGMLTTEEWYEARDTPLEETLNITPTPVGCAAAHEAAFFCDYVIRTIQHSPEFGETEQDRLDLLMRGGLRIHTTLDMDLQMAAYQVVNQHVPTDNHVGLSAALVAVEPGTGHIRMMVQNMPFDNSRDPEEGTTAINFNAGPLQGASRGFQTGSAFKPFQLAHWLMTGGTLLEHANAARIERPLTAFPASCVNFNNEPWNPRNVDGQASGHVSILEGMARSVNTAFTYMATLRDLCELRDVMWDMGFRPTSSVANPMINYPTIDDIEVLPAMIMGTQATSPVKLATAYATLAAEGKHCDPIAITRVIDAEGRDFPVPSANCNPNALPRDVAVAVTYSLQAVMTQAHGTGRASRLAGGRPSAGKTGTTQGASQTWFVGYTPQLVTTAWVGSFEGERAHFNINWNGRFVRHIFGGLIAAPMWADFMNRAHYGLPHEPFPAIHPDLLGTPPAPQCPYGGEYPYCYPSPYHQPEHHAPPAEAPPADE